MEESKLPNSALSVSKGVPQPPSVNPRLQKIKRRQLSTSDYITGIRNGDRSILGQAITIVESNLPQHVIESRSIIEGCLPYSGNSLRIGITGVPGVGKSSFIESMGTYITGIGKKLAVLAIDPSSDRSKGSILGDKTRMETLSANDRAFIRPSPSAGTLGGVARKTRESILLCEAAGFDVVFVETVGVGQSEIAVHSMVDFFLLLMLAGAGDELQGIKRGIMEMADLLAITKADGSNQDNAQRARAEYSSALHLFPASDSGWVPEVVTCSSHRNEGMAAIWDKMNAYHEFTTANWYFQKRRNKQSLYWMNESIEEGLKANFFGNSGVNSLLETYRNDVLDNSISPFTAAQRILEFYFKNPL